MKRGVGAASSLWWVAQRFAQRAVTAFFAGQRREFVVDAGAAVEYLAKLVVVDRCPADLYEPAVRAKLTPDEIYVLRPSATRRPAQGDLDQALDRLAARETIKGGPAMRVANDAEHLAGAIDMGAAKRIRLARNRGLHLGDFDDDVDGLAHDLLLLVEPLCAGAHRTTVELWSYWSSVVTSDHMTAQRTPTAESDIRVRAAWNRSFSSTTTLHRLSQFRLSGDTATRACPVCANTAGISTIAGEMAPALCVEPHERTQIIEVLDCLFCGLTLFGGQIASAEARRCLAPPRPPTVGA